MVCLHSWQKHGETKTLFETLQFVGLQDADCVVLENVLGLAQAYGAESSPLDMVLAEMEAMHYKCSTQRVDLALFHEASRPRHLLLHSPKSLPRLLRSVV